MFSHLFGQSKFANGVRCFIQDIFIFNKFDRAQFFVKYNRQRNKLGFLCNFVTIENLTKKLLLLSLYCLLNLANLVLFLQFSCLLKSLVWFVCLSLNYVSAKQMHNLFRNISSTLILEMKHSPQRRDSTSTLQLHFSGSCSLF